MLTPSMQRNNSKLAVRDAYFVHFSSRLNAYSEADSSGSPDFLVLKLSFCPGGSAKHAPGIGLVGALTNRAVNRENKEVASQKHVGLWRSLGARFHGMEEVVGSIPTRSTKSNQQFSSPSSNFTGLFLPKIRPKISQLTIEPSLMASRNLPCAAIWAALTRCVWI